MAPASQPAHKLRIGGFVPLSTVDYPGALAAVLFCQGCPWRCTYCHNQHLLPRHAAEPVAWDAVRDFLLRRRGLLDAVVFSGGEPTLQQALPAAMREVKSLGFAVALHTAGISPVRLREVVGLLDWVGLDIKAPFDHYAAITGRAGGVRARESLEILQAAGVPFEVRTTVAPEGPDRASVASLAQLLARAGVRRYVLQPARSSTGRPPPDIGDLAQRVAPLFPEFELRG